jgi:hypothetical protein
MTKEQQTTNLPGESRTNMSEELLASSSPARTGPYRSLSAKRPRDPSHRKSVSFNDVPIVHEVPSHDAMRNSNCDTYRSWTYTDATPPTSIIPSFYSSQLFSPFNSSNAAAQKLHANRLSSSFYATPSTTITSTTPNRIPDWAVRVKTSKPVSTAEELNTPNEYSTTWNPSLITGQTSDEKTNKDIITKSHNQSTYSSPYAIHSQQQQQPPPPPPPPVSSLTMHSENGDEKKFPYRSALVPDTEHYRSLPFTYGPLSDSTATYTSMLSTNLIQSNHSSNEQPTTAHTRTARARSATLPVTVTHSAQRMNDTVSITPFRPTTAALLPNGSNASTRTILRPTTIAFQCSQPGTTTNTINSSPTVVTTMAANNNNPTNLYSTTTIANATKPPTASQRYASSAAAAAAAHSRFVLPPHRTFSTASLTSSAIKYAFAHPAMDATFPNTMTPHTTIPKPPPTAYPRSRSANVLSTRRVAASSAVMNDGQSNGGTTTSTTNSNTNLYATAKRNPNVRQTYGSYYMHRVLLPTTIN